MADSVPTLNPILITAMREFKQAEDAESEWRSKGLEADKFRVGDQWPANVQQTRKLESRPCLTINQLPKFIRQVTNDMRMNRPSVKFVAVRDATEEQAKILEGLVRSIQVNSNADVAYDTAGDSAVAKGWGYFRVITEYCDDMSFDQDIKIKRIKNAFSVYFDPDCQEPDYSDAKYAFIISDVPAEEFKRMYPNADIGSFNASSVGDDTPDWMEGEVVRVAEYFKVEEKKKTIFMLSDGTTITEDEADKMAETGLVPDFVLDENGEPKSRETKIRKVIWRKITANNILEESEWPGKYIPIIPVLGEDLDVDGKRYLKGMVQDAMDPQRQYNYMSTAQTEAIALSPKAPFVGAAQQFENYKQFWANANIQPFPYLPYTPTVVNGIAVPPPQRNQAEPPVQAMVQATTKAAEDLKGVTGIFDAGLGNHSNETSGKAILARQKEGDVSNFHYIDNLSRAIRFLGVMLLDLIPHIYDAPRVLRIIGEDDSSKTVHVNTPLGPDGKPLPANATQDAMAKIFDLTNKSAKYDVTVTVGPSFSTKRQESADAMISLAQASPNLMAQAGDLIVKNMDFPMADELATRLKMFLPPNVQEEADGKEPLPPQVQAQMTQMSQMIEQMTARLNELQDEKDNKSADLASKEKIASENNQTKLIIEALRQETAASQALMMAELQQLAANQQMASQMQQAEHQASLQSQEIPQQAA